MLIVLQAKNMGRKQAGEKKLSNAEKQKKYCEKNKEILKEKDKLRKRKSREKYEGLPTITQENKSQKEEKNGDKKMQQTTTLMRNHWSPI